MVDEIHAANGVVYVFIGLKSKLFFVRGGLLLFDYCWFVCTIKRGAFLVICSILLGDK